MISLDALRHGLLRFSLRLIARPRAGARVKLGPLQLRLPSHVSHPRPAPLLNLVSLFERASREVQRGERVLEMGAGAGLWGLLSAQRGAQLSVSDLPSCPLDHIAEALERAGLAPAELYSGDLFSGLPSEARFEHIVFNPPFHLEAPRADWERAYFGGGSGEVVTRFLAEAPRWLSERGALWICLPERERARYQEALSAYRVERVKAHWLPLLGLVRLLKLRPLSAPLTRGESLGVLSPVAESFWHLSQLMNTQSAELLTVEGALCPERLRAAIKQVCARHPLTSAELRPRAWRRPEWRARPELSPELRVIELEQAKPLVGEEGLWRGALPEVIREQVWAGEPLDPQRGPATRFVLLREGPRSHVMIIAPHLCTDARAGAALLSELLMAYGAEPLPELRPWRPRDPLSLEHLSWSRRARLSLVALYRLARDLATSGRGVVLGAREVARAPRGRSLLSVSPREPKELSRALKVAKASGLTAHILFTWALMSRERRARGQRDLSDHQLRLADLIALSPLYPKERQAEQLSRFDVLVLPHVINHKLNEPLSAFSERFKAQLAALRAGEALAELYRLRLYNLCARLLPIRSMSAWLFKRVLKTSTTTTNPGPVRVPLERCGEHQVLDFINFPQLSPPARLGVIYTTFRGRLRLLILHDEALMSAEEASSFADELWAEVMGLVGSLERGEISL